MGLASNIGTCVFYSIAVVVALVAIGLGKYVFVLERWSAYESLDRENFNAANWKIHQESEIPTTYYSAGKLGEVLPKWHHNAFHLYRLKEGESFNFDTSTIKSSVVGKKLDYSCMSDPDVSDCFRRSSLITNCVFDYNNTETDETMIQAETILSGEGRGYRAAFANLTNREVIKTVWDTLNVPFTLSSTRFEHSFISNLEYPAITAPFHANGLTDSMAYQLVGLKTWVFLPPPTYVELMKGTAASSALFVKNAPPADSKPDVWLITTRPGDVLFFPNCWGHSVYTYAGPNLLMNFRKIYPGNFINQPVIWISTILEYFLTQSHRVEANTNQDVDDEEVKKLSRFVPTKKENIRVNEMYQKLCTSEGRSPFDEQILSILDEEVKRVETLGIKG